MMENIKEAAAEMLRSKMNIIVSEMADDMRNHLIENKHVDTGALLGSIKSGTERKDDTINAYVDITAESEEGAWYAEFLEFGTGIYNESGDGRQTPWKYQDRNGQWHTTQGMQADPFIRPAVASHIGELETAVKESYDLKRYRGMKS